MAEIAMGEKTVAAEKIVLKIGGSIITKRDVESFPLGIEEIKRGADEYIRYDNVKRIAGELREALDEKNIQLILVNGVGPFGHFLVKHKRPNDEVQESVKFLNEKIIAELRKIGIDAVPIPPSKSCEFAAVEGDGEFDISYLWEVGKVLLEEGKILSTYGDMLRGGKVISGDDLVVLLAEKWQAKKIITATDVGGVFTKDPKTNSDAKLIKRLSDADSAKVEYTIDKVDVTGGMASKVEKLKRAAGHGVKCQIINGLKEGNIKSALLGDETIGTLILF